MVNKTIQPDIEQLEEELENLLSAVNNARSDKENSIKEFESLVKEIAEKKSEFLAINNDIIASQKHSKKMYGEMEKEEISLIETRQALVSEIQALDLDIENTKNLEQETRESSDEYFAGLDTKKKEILDEVLANEKERDVLQEENRKMHDKNEELERHIKQSIDELNNTLKKALEAKVILEQVQERALEDATKSLGKVEANESLASDIEADIVIMKGEIEAFGKEKETITNEIKELEAERGFLEEEKNKVNESEDNLRLLSSHLTSREEHIRGRYEAVNLEYPEFK